MNAKHYARLASMLIAGGAAFAAAAYATFAGVTWFRYGRNKRQVRGEEMDSLLDLYIPEFEVAERHYLGVAAPAATTFAAACKTDLSHSAIVRSLFKLRELALGCPRAPVHEAGQNGEIPEVGSQTKELLAQVKAIGWGVLAEIPGHEIVFGAVTQPWLSNLVFRSVPPEEFANFREPGYVKIAWMLRADPIDCHTSIVRTETRVITTDAFARFKFRRYWSMILAGVVLIRKALLRAVKTEAERRARAAQPEYETAEFGRYAG
jgi:hypothetical protein